MERKKIELMDDLELGANYRIKYGFKCSPNDHLSTDEVVRIKGAEYYKHSETYGFPVVELELHVSSTGRSVTFCMYESDLNMFLSKMDNEDNDRGYY